MAEDISFNILHIFYAFIYSLFISQMDVKQYRFDTLNVFLPKKSEYHKFLQPGTFTDCFPIHKTFKILDI